MSSQLWEVILKGNQKSCVYFYLSKSNKFIYFLLSLFYFAITTFLIDFFLTYFYMVTLTLLIKSPMSLTIQDQLFYTSSILSITFNLFIVWQLRFNILSYAILIQKILFVIGLFLSELISTAKSMFVSSYLISSIVAISVTSMIFGAEQDLHKQFLARGELFLIIFALTFLLIMFSMSEIFFNEKREAKGIVFWTTLFIAISLVTLAQIINDYLNNYSSGLLTSIGAGLALVFSYGAIYDKVKSIIHPEIIKYSRIIDDEINELANIERSQLKENGERFKALTISKKIQLFLTLGLLACFYFVEIFNIYNFNDIIEYPIVFLFSKAEYFLNEVNNWEPRFYGVLFLSIIFLGSIYRMVLNLKQLKNITRKNVKIFIVIKSIFLVAIVPVFLTAQWIGIYATLLIVCMLLIIFIYEKIIILINK